MFRHIGQHRASNYYKITNFKIPKPEFTEATQPVLFYDLRFFVKNDGLITDMSKHVAILNVIR